MTDRDVMQQALEALERNASQDMSVVQSNMLAMAALRARLAEPEPEPVAFRWKVKINDVDGWVVGHNEPPPYAIEQQPLYTTPPTRRPLTNEEIKQAVLNDPIYGAALMSMMRDGVTVAQLREAVSGIARAIERKITGGNDE